MTTPLTREQVELELDIIGTGSGIAKGKILECFADLTAQLAAIQGKTS